MIDFDKLIEAYLFREQKAKTSGRYYPSEVGQCLRKVWFSYKQPKPIEPNVAKIFEAGNMMHGFVVDVIRSEKNPEIELLETESPLTAEYGDFIVSGRIDDIILIKQNNEKFIVEVKSCKDVEKIWEPSRQYIMQLQFYMHVTGIHRGMLLYVEKNTLKSKSFFFDYDQAMAEGIVGRFTELNTNLKQDTIPEPEAKVDRKMRWMCYYCNYRQECDNVDGDKYGKI
jgi:CRISPR/Cas system-associated exonuclease Cas4 (RecB family)